MVLYWTTYAFIGDFARGLVLAQMNPWWHEMVGFGRVWVGPPEAELIARARGI